MLARRPARAIIAPALLAFLAGCTTVSNTQIAAPQAAALGGGPAGAIAVQSQARRPAPTPPRLTDADLGGKVPAVRRTYAGTIPFLGRDTPLPAGEWTAISRHTVQFRGDRPPTDEVTLLRHDGPVLTGLLLLFGTPVNKPAANGLPPGIACQESDVTASSIRSATPFGEQDCVAVKWTRTGPWRSAPSATLRGIAASLDIVGVTPPPVLVGVMVFEVDAQHELSYNLLLNPDREGVAPDLATQPSQSGWAAINIGRDPAKKAFAERLLAWGEAWRDIVRQVLADERPRIPAQLAQTP